MIDAIEIAARTLFEVWYNTADPGPDRAGGAPHGAGWYWRRMPAWERAGWRAVAVEVERARALLYDAADMLDTYHTAELYGGDAAQSVTSSEVLDLRNRIDQLIGGGP